jgi:hypothetical protein
LVGGIDLPVNVVSTLETTPPLGDSISSIYYIIHNNLVNAFNELFDDKLLDRTYFQNEVGIQARELIDTIFSSNAQGGIDDIIGYDFTNNQSAGYIYDTDPINAVIDFYKYTLNSSLSIPKNNILNFISTNYIDIMSAHKQYYENNKKLLTLCNISANPSTYYDRYLFNFDEYKLFLDNIALTLPYHDSVMLNSVEDIYDPYIFPDPNISDWRYINAIDVAIELFGSESDGKTMGWNENNGFLFFMWSMYGPYPSINPYTTLYPGTKIEEMWDNVYNEYYSASNFDIEFDGLNAIYAEIYKYSAMIGPLLDSKTVEVGFNYFPFISTPLDPFINGNNWVFNVLNGLSPEYIYSNLNKIEQNYHNFKRESDVIDFLKDTVLSTTSFNPTPEITIPEFSGTPAAPASTVDNNYTILNISDLATNSVTETYNNLVIYFNNLKSNTADEITKLNILEDKIKILAKGGTKAKFAWTRRLGHYIIDYVNIKIGDQIIDSHSGEWLEIWHSLTHKDTQEDKYKIMISDIEKLTTYNKAKKCKHTLYIPLQFWFCKYIGSSLPLIAMQNTNIEFIVKLKSLSEIASWEKGTIFRTEPELECIMLAEYIYVEQEERIRIVQNKHEQLIEQLQYNGGSLITNNIIQVDHDNRNVIEEDLYFRHPTKELIWVIQDLDFVNGNQDDGIRKYYNYSNNFDDILNHNPTTMAKIQFLGRDRENYKSGNIYNSRYVFDYHFHSPQEGVNIYPLCLEPENVRPSGSANLSRLDDTRIKIIISDDMIENLNNNKIYRLGVYARTYNILRIMSGLSGLAYLM